MFPGQTVKLTSYQERHDILNYDDCTVGELIAFTKSRSIVVPPQVHGRFTKDSLVTALLEADEGSTFSRLLDLPPEIRNMIYEFYMDSFRAAPYTVYETRVLLLPDQPPLGRVSRQLRQEVLPLFYESFCFQLRFLAPPSRSRWPPSVVSHNFPIFGTYIAGEDPQNGA
jgi:hypothetical protein